MKELGKVLGMPVVCRKIEEVKNQALSVYFIASGGAEPGFNEVYKQVEEPYILLTTPAYNSLAAAMRKDDFFLFRIHTAWIGHKPRLTCQSI